MKPIRAVPLLLATLFACRTASLPLRMPEGYVVTPNGLMHGSCIRVLESGESISRDGVVIHRSGERETLPPCRHPRLDPRTFSPLAADTGWVLSAGWTSPAPLGELRASFTVPSAPASSAATFYFFPAITPGPTSGPIMQTDLGWHPDSAQWMVSPAFCCPQGWRAKIRHVNVSPGDSLQGSITRCAPEPAAEVVPPCTWRLVITDVTTGQASALLVSDTTTFQRAGGGTMEAYWPDACNQFPASGSISFSRIVLKDQDGNVLQPQWSSHYWRAALQCGFNIAVAPATVTLTWTP
ncbi:MAG TPA: hypothetical protein VFS20_18255 [Longimicrobium sp.]|nr:hypothetical protein [Longimicrobium sp.]